VGEAKALYCEYPGAPDSMGPAAGLRGIAAGGRTLEKLDEKVESAIDTLEIMSDPTTLKNIE